MLQHLLGCEFFSGDVSCWSANQAALKLCFAHTSCRGPIKFKVVAIEAPDAASGRRGVASEEVVVKNAVRRYSGSRWDSFRC